MNRQEAREIAPGPTPIAIVGMSCLFPDAPGLREYWRLIRRGEDAIREIPETHFRIDDYYDSSPSRPDHVHCRRGSFIPGTAFDPVEFGIPPAILEATDTAQLLGLVVGKQALLDAGYGPQREFDRTRASVILGVTGTLELVIPLGARLGHPIWRKAMQQAGIDPGVADDVVRRISDAYVGWQENSFPGLLGNVVAGRIANRLNLQGTNCVVDAACASSLSAMHMASLELASGRADVVLTGGVDTLNDIFMFMCFAKTQALSPSGDARPFSKDADGTVIGEGVGMLVLKRLADAERDGDRIYAVLRGIGTSSDGRSQSIYAPRAEGQAIALRNAYAAAGVDPATVELVEAHGTGTRVGDVVEFEALRSVYRESRGEGRWCALGSVKSQIGHTKAAAGVASLIKSVLALRHRTLPASIKVGEPNPKLEIESSPFYLSTETRPWFSHAGREAGDNQSNRETAQSPRRAAVSSFGFGGSNFHAVLEEYPAATREPAWDGSAQIVALSADSTGGLQRALADWDEIGTQLSGLERSAGRRELAKRAWESRQAFRNDHAVRLVMVVDCDTGLGEVITAARRGLETRGMECSWSEGRVAFGCGPQPGSVALLFPGQGSQYVGMGRDLVCVFPEAHDAVAAFDGPIDTSDAPPAARAARGGLVHGATRAAQWLTELIFPIPARDAAERQAQQAALTWTRVAQPALGAISVAMLRVLERFGIRADFAAGHSFGELTALHAAGSLSANDLSKLARERGAAMAASGGSDGAMLAVQAPLEQIDAAIAQSGLDVTLANRNSPVQGIISGARAAVQRVAELFDARGWRSKLLEVSAAFHSRFMAAAESSFRAALETVAFHVPKVPVLSNVTGGVYPRDVAAIRDLLAAQLTRPVMFVEEVRQLYESGVRTFVEVGPKAALTGLVRNILDRLPHHALALDAAAGRGNGLVDVARVLAVMAALGYAVDLCQWEPQPPERTRTGMSVMLVGANYRAAARASEVRPAEPSAARLEPVVVSNSGNGPKNGDGPLTAARRVAAHPPVAHVDAAAPAERAAPAGPASAAMSAPAPGQATPSGAVVHRAIEMVHEGLRAMQQLQEQTAAAHRRFLESQEHAHRTLQSLIVGHQRLLEHAAGLPVSEPPPGPPGVSSSPPLAHAPAPAIPHAPPQPVIDAARSGMPPACGAQRIEFPQARVPRSPALAPHEPVPIAAAAPQHASPAPVEHIEAEGVADTLLHVVSETTGLPLDHLHLDLDLESDLAIDRIQRVEVLSRIQQRIPGVRPPEPAAMGDFRTLRDMAEFLAGGNGKPNGKHEREHASPQAAPAAAATAAAATAGEGAEQVMLEVVAELTGYPVEMLDLDMDMEADLGIDSIKRLEILSAVQRRRPDLQTVDSQYLGSLRTLRNVIDYMRGEGESSAGPPEPAGEALGKAVEAAAEIAEPAAVDVEVGSAQRVERRAVKPVALERLAAAAPLRIAAGRAVLVTDDGGGFSEALVEELQRRGVEARLVDASAIDEDSARGAAGLVIFGRPRGRAANQSNGALDAAQWSAESAAALRAVQVAAAPLRDAARHGRALLATVARLDGRFGLSGSVANAAHGPLAGLAKTAAQEWPGVCVRALDVDPHWNDLAAAARAIADELAVDGPLEVGLGPAGRFGLVLERSRPVCGELPLADGDVVLISGGARGVTADTAIALARRAALTLVLLGRSEPPQPEPAWLAPLRDEAAIKRALLAHAFAGERPAPVQLEREYRRRLAAREVAHTLRCIESAGSRAVYETVDVRDAAAVAGVVERARRLGPIRGIVHAAGVIEDQLIEAKARESFARVFDTKVAGLAALLSATDRDDLRVVALFSSVSGRFGRRGQVDYAMANEALNKAAWVIRSARPGCRVVSLNWGPWDGGMVTPALKREFEREGVGLIGRADGAAALIAELCSKDDAVEVVLGSGFPEPAAATADSRAAASGGTARAAAAPVKSAEAPRGSLSLELSEESHAFLAAHRIAGRAVLPVAMMIEWLAHAALHENPGLAVLGLDELKVLRGVRLDRSPRAIELTYGKPRRRDGRCEVDTELRPADSAAAPPFARACILLGDQIAADAPTPPDVSSWGLVIREPNIAPHSFAQLAYGPILFHGPLLRGLEQITACQPRGVVARARPAGPPGTWMREPLRSDWLIDPLLTDCALQLGLIWSYEQLGHAALPSRIGSLRLFVPSLPREPLTLILQAREHDPLRLVANVYFVDRGRTVALLKDVLWTLDPSRSSMPAAAAGATA